LWLLFFQHFVSTVVDILDRSEERKGMAFTLARRSQRIATAALLRCRCCLSTTAEVTKEPPQQYLFTWGTNQHGTLLQPAATVKKLDVPTRVPEEGLSISLPVSKIICGPTETVLLAPEQCWVTGENKYGQLGTSSPPQPVPSLTPIHSLFPQMVREVALSTHFAAYVVGDEGDLYTAGFGGSTLQGVGCLGHGDIASRHLPTRVESLVEDGCSVQQVVAGESHCSVLTTEGEILTVGSGSYGRLGNFETTDQLYFEPVEMESGLNIVQIAGGKSFTLALTRDGVIYGWGRNHKGQLGTGLGLAVDMYAMQAVPEPIDTSAELSSRKIVRIAAGHSHAACISEAGEVFVWGMSLHLEPVLVDSLLHTRIVDIVCGQDYTLAIDENGHMYSFGISNAGVLGHGSQIRQLNQAKLIESLQTGEIESGTEGNTQRMRRRVVQAAAGWKHAACVLEEEPVLE
jgi:alpha-tubulin suppressor-like RCC1 family protein